MAIDLNKQETIRRMQGSPRLKTKLFLNPMSGADKNELSRFLRDTEKGQAFCVTIIEK
ncbi:MAG: hypothetical protein P8I01_10485 [Paracoccaceae bacterium]|jgi:hypothetical protein|nr:hypothetical protein [Paracoccaceae bacterium]